MTFGQLIADGLDENLSVQNWYLVEEGKGASVFVCLVFACVHACEEVF